MVDTRRLKAVIMLHDGNQQALADAIGLSRGNLSLRINNHKEFTNREITFIRNRYDLSDSETALIFFAEKVS